MTKDREIEDSDVEQPRQSRYKDEIAAPSAGPNPSEPAQGVAPSSSKVGEDVERPQYGNVIRPSIEHDEGEGEDDVQPGSDDVLAP